MKAAKKLGSGVIASILLALLLMLGACGGDEATPVPTSPETVEEELAPAKPAAATATANSPSSYLLFNQKLVEGLTTESVDLSDVDAVFWHIFSRLPDEVTVYPSENYYYFIMYTDRRQLWGNIRLAAGRRERGVLSFAYFEFRETPYVTEPRVSASKFFTNADGLLIEELTDIPQIEPPFLDIAPAGMLPTIISHSKGVKCVLIRSNSSFHGPTTVLPSVKSPNRLSTTKSLPWEALLPCTTR